MSLNYVRFDLGHYLHLCHRDTLLKFEDSTLAKMVKSELDQRKSSADYIVIDRNGKHFGAILDYMRDQTSFNLERWTETNIEELQLQADFYNLTDLMELCKLELEKKIAARFRNKLHKFEPFNMHCIFQQDSVEEFLNSLQECAVIMNFDLLVSQWMRYKFPERNH